ncbi:MAG: HD-GYP domain-containing protein [Pseudomonadota bacterium]|nr:HD-GYP domain-containing protein [Xanthomonadaceae bacterium]MDE3210843.1 HD-GYP domain-containing protein [Pseudomonadota bacterium]
MPQAVKKIPISQVTRGMFVRKIAGRWMDHPFWKGSFLVADDKTLQTLLSLGDKEVWIDTRKGADVAVAAAPAPPIAAAPEPEPPPVEAAVPRSDFGSEVAQAERIRDRARGVVKSLFADARMGKALSMDAAVEIVEEVGHSITSNPEAILSVLRLKKKDDYTYLHSVAVAALMMALGRRLGIEGEPLRELGMAGLLHDIGKVGVADAVLNKPGRLSPLEMISVRLHPVLGWDILCQQPGTSKVVLDVCLHHHEKVDGNGYPDKLSGDDLSRAARMGAICDVYDAITSERCYKDAWQPAEAIRRMAEWQEGHFDRQLFHAFVKMIGIYPTGTLVRLASDRLAVVLVQGRGSSLSPIVRAFRALPSNEELAPVLVDLEDPADSIVGIEDPRDWDIDVPALLLR